MGKIIADLHIHSGYSRATSKEMNVESLALWAKKKGINLIGTGDFTHPQHFANLKKSLQPSCSGLYSTPSEPSVNFMLTAEVSSIYKQNGKVRKTHNKNSKEKGASFFVIYGNDMLPVFVDKIQHL